MLKQALIAGAVVLGLSMAAPTAKADHYRPPRCVSPYQTYSSFRGYSPYVQRYYGYSPYRTYRPVNPVYGRGYGLPPQYQYRGRPGYGYGYGRAPGFSIQGPRVGFSIRF